MHPPLTRRHVGDKGCAEVPLPLTQMRSHAIRGCHSTGALHLSAVLGDRISETTRR
jgi:hypothetical protein